MDRSVIADRRGVGAWPLIGRGLLLATTVAAGGLAIAPAAHALPVSIMLSESGYTSQTFSGSGSAGTYDFVNHTPFVSFGTFSVQASAAGSPLNPMGELIGNSLGIASNATGTLNVSVTETGQTSPTGSNIGFLSSFTSNLVDSGLTVTGTTYVDPTNVAFGTTTQLATHVFSSNGTFAQVDTVPLLTGLYSETEVFTIVATQAGDINATIDLTPVPEPASFAVLGVGLLGLLPVWHQRRRT